MTACETIYTVGEYSSNVSKTVKAIKFKDIINSYDTVKRFVGEKYIHLDASMNIRGSIDRQILISGDVTVDGKTTIVNNNDYIIKFEGYNKLNEHCEDHKFMILPEMHFSILFKQIGEQTLFLTNEEGEQDGQ